jgi:hypothetical protein
MIQDAFSYGCQAEFAKRSPALAELLITFATLGDK